MRGGARLIGVGRAAGALLLRRKVWPIAAFWLLAIVAFAVWHFAIRAPAPDAPEEQLARAREALEQGEYRRAEVLASGIVRDSGVWARARLVAGEAATRAGRIGEAIAHYRSVSGGRSQASLVATYSLAEVFRDMGRLSDAEREYRRVLARQPNHAQAHDRLAFILGVTGRRWESAPHFLFLIRDRSWRLSSLALLGDLERPIEQKKYIRRCVKNAPDDVLVQLAQATYALVEGESTKARRLLRKVVGRRPDLMAAQCRLGELLVNGEPQAYLEWHAALPPEAEAYPDTWYVRGLWARRQDELRVAARCFWETLRRVPEHRRACYQLSQVLASLDHPAAEEFGKRASRLLELSGSLDDVLRSGGRDQAAMRRVTELMEATGRLWEAWAWAVTSSRRFPDASWPMRTIARVSSRLEDDPPRTTAEANLALKHDFSKYPGYATLRAAPPVEAGPAEEPDSRTSAPEASIRFADEASEAGIDFTYYNAPDPETEGARMFEQTGGGVAVLDYDRDGAPDLYFAQGTHWEHGSDEPERTPEITDHIYRNRGGRSFLDVTGKTGLGNTGFGQGVAAGDFDNDGFPDLYVANVGEKNQFYRNNGDGTFSDITEKLDLVGEDWTVSCAMVDLNADGFADLYDANYVQGKYLYELICQGHACSPEVFDGAPNRLHINQGDGTFRTASNASTANPTNGKSLGVVAADIHGTGRPSLFVANDQVANFLLRNQPAETSAGVRLVEEAFISGVAFNDDGLAMASMGIAADDANGDGRLDLFTTNFRDEANTFYLQDSSGLFVDATSSAGLEAPSWPYVGWGTQFLDADLDGDSDIVLCNGHVDDYRDEGVEYHMRPQFFKNTGGGRFVEMRAEDLGDYFGRKYLGRGLARLDWNGDGRMDFVVSNIGDRVSLVTNRSTGCGHFVNVRLHGTAGARDAICSRVEVVTEERHWRKQLVAGDGYMACNQRLLQFGIGRADTVEELRVQWPSGETTTVRAFPANVTIDVIEGAPWAVQWSGSDSKLLLVDGREG